jgi:hypothetical protein
MLLREIFEKDINRPIEGVIKADDVSHLGSEVDEYVLTNEAAKGLEQFLEAYTDYTNANGVWISGFFGSGKSHMLKMLAHLLGDVEGQNFPRTEVSDSFLTKSAGAFLPALLSKAAAMPAKSLLFNIDQKATLISKNQNDALLKVFVKVFDDSCGYYGNVGHIAKFERDLDKRGQYQAFKDSYGRIAGQDWAKGREESILEEANVAKAFAEIIGDSDSELTNILTKYRDEYAVSIEDFADDVSAWLATQDPDFRLLFFVDELGQFIGGDAKLMLNAQTVAESLNTKCNGRAWVIVTSQEDMDKVIGDRTKQQGNDFSKIQARFATRIKLTSADVEEVIRKRLLEKNPLGATELERIYDTESANFKTLFDFVDGAKTYRNFTDESHFVGTYPFVTYQFPLFQAALEGISDHNVFEGRNSSVGERSMLGVVQHVAKEIGKGEVGSLATFDELFAGIRASLKSAAQRSITVAEQHLENPLAVKLLKALFLVKHVEAFHATNRNLTVLMYDRFGRDLPQLSKDVQAALSLLEQQTYVQRNGNLYEYLTNEEQVIEEEIKNVDLDASDISQRLAKLISEDVLKINKIRYDKNRQDFPFGLKLDDQPHGPQKDLTIHVISPAYEHDLSEVRMHSAGKDELRVVMGADRNLTSDLRLLLQTEKYIKRKQGVSQSASEQRILLAKAAQNEERRKELIQRAGKAIGASTLIINVTDVEAPSQDPVARVSDGFQDLIRRTYPQLSLLGGVTYTEQQIAGYVNPDDPGLLIDVDVSVIAVAAEEVLSFVSAQERLGVRVTVKAIVDNFEGKPYGWYLAAIQVSLGHLVGTSKITLNVDGNTLRRSEVPTLLRNTQKFAHVTVTVQKQYDDRKVRALREFCTQFFDDPGVPKEPLELARSASERLAAERGKLQEVVLSSTYPFIHELDQCIGLLDEVIGKPDGWYLDEFGQHVDGLLEAKESVVVPIRAFLAGPQKTIYDQATMLLQTHRNNLTYLPQDAATPVQEILDDPRAFRGNRMQQLKAAASALEAHLNQRLASERATTLSVIEIRIAELTSNPDYARATADVRQNVAEQVNALELQTNAETQIALVTNRAAVFEETTYPALVDLVFNSIPADVDELDKHNLRETVSIRSIKVSAGIAILQTEGDVDAYLDAYRDELLKVIGSGKRVTL